MKHNRKWLALALTGAMTLSLLVGCAGKDVYKRQDYFRQGGASSQHGGGNLFARDPEVMGWLFEQ